MPRLRSIALAICSVTALSTSTLWLGAGSADAIAGCPSYPSHCHAVARYGPVAGQQAYYLNAVGADLEVDCLWVDNPYTDFVNYELWMTTNNNYSATGYWVEGGMTAGTLSHGVGGHPTGFLWYWADMRPNGGGYWEHYISDATTGTYTNLSFYWAGNGAWNVYKGGSYVGQSTYNGDWAGGGQTGAESTSPNIYVSGNTRNWQWLNGSGRWDWITVDTPYNNNPGLLSLSVNGPSVHAQTNTK
jgi:hypothetical protein